MPGPEESRCKDWQDRSITHQCCPPCPLQWSKDGQGVLIHAKVYKQEMEKNKNLFPELAELSCVTALQAWLLAHGFKLRDAK